ncbi:histone deacetylase complex subunit SAP30 [Sarcoptes scabiei]|nr:histone deacetylase complex subunit SAP30 [Sarcoptes scabiei]
MAKKKKNESKSQPNQQFDQQFTSDREKKLNLSDACGNQKLEKKPDRNVRIDNFQILQVIPLFNFFRFPHQIKSSKKFSFFLSRCSCFRCVNETIKKSSNPTSTIRFQLFFISTLSFS